MTRTPTREAHSLTLPDGTRCEVMGLSDLVQAKKTQRDKLERLRHQR